MKRVAPIASWGVLAGLALGMSATLPAIAHPESEVPQRIEASAIGDVVRIVWSAALDDRASLVYQLGIAPGARTFVFEDGELVPGESDLTDDEVLASSPEEVGRYLLDHISVVNAGQRCDGIRVDTAAVATSGVVIDFECAAPVERAQVSVSTLTDIDPAYESAAVVDSVPVARWNAEVDTIDFVFGPDGVAVSAIPERGLDPIVPISIAAVAVLLGVAAFALVRRRQSGATAGNRRRRSGHVQRGSNIR